MLPVTAAATPWWCLQVVVVLVLYVAVVPHSAHGAAHWGLTPMPEASSSASLHYVESLDSLVLIGGLLGTVTSRMPPLTTTPLTT